MGFLAGLYTLLLVAICLLQALLLYRTGKPAVRQDDEALKEWLRQQLEAQARVLEEKQAQQAQQQGEARQSPFPRRPSPCPPSCSSSWASPPPRTPTPIQRTPPKTCPSSPSLTSCSPSCSSSWASPPPRTPSTRSTLRRKSCRPFSCWEWSQRLSTRSRKECCEYPRPARHLSPESSLPPPSHASC